MQNYSFKDIMNLEINVTNKLLKYMYSKIDVLDFIENFDLDLSYIDDQRNNLAFNLWLSIDYTDKDGESFIEKFLKDDSSALTEMEKEILKEKSKSYISLFEILDFNKGHVILKDLLNNIEHTVLEPNIHKVIQVGDFLFTRIGKILDTTIFMGDINYVPSAVKDVFLEELLVDFNMVRKLNGDLSMMDYLKNYSLHIYKMYNDALLRVIDMNGDISSLLFDELDEFEFFLMNKYNGAAVKKHINNLTSFFEYTLEDKDLTLQDMDRVDFSSFFNEAIKEGFINSHEEFNSYLRTLKAYSHYLCLMDPHYRETYNRVLEISQNRFKYMYKIDTSNDPGIDKDLVSLINGYLNDEAIVSVLDFEKFILYIGDTNIKLTKTRKLLRRRDLIELNSILENSIVVDKRAPNQFDFPLINFFFHASLYLGIVEVEGTNLNLTKKGFNILRYSDEEKYSLLIQYLWSKVFIKDILSDSDTLIYDILRDKIVKNLADLKVGKEYSLNDTLAKLDGLLCPSMDYIVDLGLTRIQQDEDVVTVTNLGKRVFNYLQNGRRANKASEIIKLEDYRKASEFVEG